MIFPSTKRWRIQLFGWSLCLAVACSASAEDLLSAPNTPEEVHKVHRHLSSSESSFINEEQQQCLGLCGVEYEDLLQAASVENASSDGKVLRILSFDTGDMDHMGRKKAAEMYFERTGVRVLFELVPDFLGTYDEIRSQLEGKLPLYDGFICGPAIVGTAVQLDGFLDLTSYTREHQELKWLDVLRGFRENIAVYDGRVRMFPLDGDAHFMYYREDVLEAFNLQVPRTWDEYWQVAKAVHGKTFKNQTMVGNCVGMMPNGHVAYWASLVLSSYTQTNGATQGFILDSKDLSPLMGEAMAETLKMLELQATFGHPDVFETCGGGEPCSVNIEAMNRGECALTYNWGDSYKVSHAQDPPSQIIGLMKVAPTPGTDKIYSRKTKRLEPCNKENCGSGRGGIYYEDIGWVNRASYLAFGGWSAAVNNNIDPQQQKLILDFFSFMNGPEVSTDAAIPNASTAMQTSNGVDVFRASHLEVEKWVQKGFTRESVESYKAAVEETLNHPNAAYDMRFAGADRIFSTLEDEVYSYLEKAVLLDSLPDDEEERQKIRLEAANRMEQLFREIIVEEDSKAETLVPLLEQYQRDLGIYKPPADDDDNITLAISIPIVAAVMVGAALLAFYFKVKNSENDSVWKVKKEELTFPDPQQVIGSGTFGLVLLAEYRGTQVAIKRVLPPKNTDAKSLGKRSTISGSSIEGSFDTNDSSDENSPYECKRLGTTSWGGMNVSGVGGMGMLSQQNATRSRIGGRSSLKSGAKSDISAKKQYKALKDDFIKEMRYLSKLRHPCITTVMGAVIPKDNESPMLLMEYMDHGSLRDILHNNTIPLEGEILLPMLCDVTQGCRFLHSSDPLVVHGDLKSANILVDSRFRAKVADFGLSGKQRIGVTGTPFWMAPELLREETTNNTATDVYAFGIMMYEALSRNDPYHEEDAREVLKAVADPKINKRPPIPAGCPEQLAAMMNECLLANPDERPSFEELDKRMRRVDAKTVNGLASMSNKRADNSTISLFDIFPRHIAEALRDGKTVEAEHKDMVTVFFCDIVGFTTISSTLDPRKVANMLDRLYLKFDQLSHDHDVFKVETIGDAYMAVTNLVKDQNNDHATRIAEFAVKAIQAANDTLIDKDDPSKGHVAIRVGFHSGPVVADVVGSRNPRYCLFGDTVNTASRMESTSAMNRIHCSEIAAKMLQKQGCSFNLLSRGEINVKGKGKMETFWVDAGTPPPESALSPGIVLEGNGDIEA